MLTQAVLGKKIDPGQLISHHYNFSQMIEAYDVFSNAAENRALKVILTNEKFCS